MTSNRTLRLAYRLLRIAGLEKRIELLKRKYPKVTPEQIDKISEFDPTEGKFLEWLVRVFANKSYPPGFWNDAREMLKMYAKITETPSLAEMYGVSRDIGKMKPKDLYDVWSREYRGVEGWDKESLDSQALRAKKVKEKGSRVIYNQNGYRVVQFGGPGMDPNMAIEALCMFGAGTEWCTRKSNKARSYLEQGPVYMIFKGDYKVAQVNKDQIQDRENEKINLMENSELTKVLVESGLISPKRAYDLLARRQGEKGPWPELEPALAKDPDTAFRYADYYLKGRFPLGEKVIAQIPGAAYMYATTILNDRFPEGEETIFRDPEFGPQYQKAIDEDYFGYLRKKREKWEREQLQNA